MANNKTITSTQSQPYRNDVTTSILNAGNSGVSSNLPDSYKNLADANPYRNVEYQNGVWDNIGDVLGFRTKQDSYREELAMRANEYDSQLLSTAREEDYNSETNAAARMRAAGLNPDLTGTDGASQASEFTEPTDHPEVPSGSNPEIQNAIGTVLSTMTSLLGFSKDVAGLKSVLIDNESKQLKNLTDFVAPGREFLLNMFGDFNNMQPDYRDNIASLSDDLSSAISPFFGNNSNRAAKYVDVLTNMLSSTGFQKDYYRSLNDKATAKRDYVVNTAGKIWNRHGQNVLRSDLRDTTELDDVLSTLSDGAAELFKLQMDYNRQSLKNKYSYEQKAEQLHLPESDAATAAAANQASQATSSVAVSSKEWQQKTYELIKQLDNKLASQQKKSKLDSGFTAVARAILAFSMSGMFQLPQINVRNSSYNTYLPGNIR